MKKKSPARRPDDTVMETPLLAITSPTTTTPDPGWAPILARAMARPGPEDGTFTDGLPPHWSATVRRNRWGTWSATGTYSGPEIGQPRQLVSGWGWTRSQAITQIGRWIEEAEQVGRWIKEAEALEPWTGRSSPPAALRLWRLGSPFWWWGLLSHDADAVVRAAAEEAAYKEDRARRREDGWVTDVGEAEAAAHREAADRTADQLLAAILHETRLANTPLEFRFPDAGYGPRDFPDDHTVEAEDRFAAHLRSHPELRVLPKWQGIYAGLDEEATQHDEYLDWEAEERVAALDTHENDIAMAHAHYERLEDEHVRLLDWDDAIAENTYRREHGHAPVEYTDPAVFDAGVIEGWADPETDPTQIDWAYRQAHALIPYEVINGHPVSPGPPTPIQRGRGGLGRWGENPMADAVITARTPDGHRHLLLVERQDGHGWAVPGGPIDPRGKPRPRQRTGTAGRDRATDRGRAVAGNPTPFRPRPPSQRPGLGGDCPRPRRPGTGPDPARRPGRGRRPPGPVGESRHLHRPGDRPGPRARRRHVPRPHSDAHRDAHPFGR